MNIYFSHHTAETIPEGFHAVTISLDASVKSRLEWKEQISQASKWKDKEKKLFWVLDFGLYDFSDSTLEILRLAVEHYEREIWEIFQDSTVGVCLYQGSCELTEDQVEFLEKLAGALPDKVEPYLLLDASLQNHLIEVSRTLSKERFPHFTLAVKGVDLPLPEFGWETAAGERGIIGTSLKHLVSVEPAVGVCVPSKGSSESLESLEQMVQDLKSQKIPFRMIPEALLTTEWQGLDHIIVDSKTVTPSGMRRLKGFCAAGGTIVTLGKMLDVPLEISAQDWIRN